jgi:hypothetical protein
MIHLPTKVRKKWDIFSKLLLKIDPQGILEYFVPGAHFVCFREGQLQTREDGPFEPREMRTDSIIEAEYEGEHFLLHVEFQSKKDGKMAERLLGYSYEATRLHKLLVLSCAIYIRAVSDVPQPPLKRVLRSGHETITFGYESVEIAKKSVGELRERHLDVLWPLMPLCKDGATREVVEGALTHLKRQDKKELIAMTLVFAALALTSEDDRIWLKRRRAMLDDYVREHSWIYHDIVEEGRVEGRVEEARQNIQSVVQVRFPELLTLAQSRIEHETDLAKLQQVLLTVSTTRSARAVKKYLLALH